MKDDRRAFDALVRRHYRLMFGMAYKWSGSRDQAADITHNAFLKMAENLHTFREESAFKTWLCRIVINTAKDWIKTNNRNRPVYSDYKDELSPLPNAEDETYIKEVLDGIQTLPDGERDAVLLVCWEGFSHKEAAKILGCRENTISWRIHSARRKLAWMQNKDQSHG